MTVEEQIKWVHKALDELHDRAREENIFGWIFSNGLRQWISDNEHELNKTGKLKPQSNSPSEK